MASGTLTPPPSLRRQVFLLRRAAPAARFLRTLPAVELETLFEGIEAQEVTLRHTFVRRGLPHGEAYVLAMMVHFLAPERIFEIGTGTGEGTLLMARQAPRARIETLDLGDASSTLHQQTHDRPLAAPEAGRAFRGRPEAERITQHFGDSARLDFSPWAGRMDLVLVDGSHDHEYVLKDSRTALRLTRAGGTVIWDDCALMHPGVSQALAQLRAEGHDVAKVKDSRLAVLRVPQEAA